MANSKIYISKAAVQSKADIVAGDFTNVSWVQIKGLFNIGDLGGDQTINEVELLDQQWMMKSKSTRNGGTMTNQFIPIALDSGQIKFLEAIEDNCNPYAFKVERGADCAPEAKVDISVASPGVVTWTNHTLQDGQPVMFDEDDGSLPTGLAASTIYYVVNSAAGTFEVAATVGGTPIVTTGTPGTSVNAIASPAGMTDLFYGLATDGARSGGSKNDNYIRTWPIAVTGRVVTI
jgi:hypothetical protein